MQIKVWHCIRDEVALIRIVMSVIIISTLAIMAVVNNEAHNVVTAILEYRNLDNSTTGNSVYTGDNLVPFSTLSNLSSLSPHPIKADCFIYGYVANNKPLGDLLIVKFKNNGSCNPTIELFRSLGMVLGIIPASGDPLKLGYDGLVFIKYIETRSTTSVVH